MVTPLRLSILSMLPDARLYPFRRTSSRILSALFVISLFPINAGTLNAEELENLFQQPWGTSRADLESTLKKNQIARILSDDEESLLVQQGDFLLRYFFFVPRHPGEIVMGKATLDGEERVVATKVETLPDTEPGKGLLYAVDIQMPAAHLTKEKREALLSRLQPLAGVPEEREGRIRFEKRSLHIDIILESCGKSECITREALVDFPLAEKRNKSRSELDKKISMEIRKRTREEEEREKREKKGAMPGKNPQVKQGN